jgi:hypothetical protein
MRETLNYWGIRFWVWIYEKLIVRAEPGMKKYNYMTEMNNHAKTLFGFGEEKYSELGRRILAANLKAMDKDIDELIF